MSGTMPKVTGCDVVDCSYNKGAQCHAMAITVGNSSHPMCDTLVKLPSKGGVDDVTGAVGACKSRDCSFNVALECSASEIRVTHHGDHADCQTYRRQ